MLSPYSNDQSRTATYIAAMESWATDDGGEDRFSLRSALPMADYTKLFSQTWWNSDYRTYGPTAMKMRNGPLRSVMRTHDFSPWLYTNERFGVDASGWIKKVYSRMKVESDNQFLWQYFFYQTIAATETEACERTWFEMQENWYTADKAIWIDRQAVRDKAQVLNAAIDANADCNSNFVVSDAITPPAMEFRQLFAALTHVKSSLGREAAYLQNLAARFLMLEDSPAKDALFQLYAERIRTRVNVLYRRVAIDVMTLITSLNRMLEENPNIRAWLQSSQAISQILSVGADELLAAVRTSHQYLCTVSDVFSDDEARRQVGVGQLGALPSAAGTTLANRIKRIAMRQYHSLKPDDPRKKVADEWSEILRSGDLLRNPAPGTQGAQINQELRNRIQAIDAGVAAHDAAVASSHPDPQGQRQIASSALQNRQPPAGGEFLLPPF